MPLVHHELCFGCGRGNVFGLLLDAEHVDPGTVARCFVKQDHQGADPGNAHEGVIAAALSEAMALACGTRARARSFQVTIIGSVPIGAFLEIEARVHSRESDRVQAVASANCDGAAVASATGTYAV